MIEKVSDNSLEAEVKFMCPHGPSSYFSWPSHDDVCWVPAENIICILSPPVAATSTARKYLISKADLACIQKNYN